MVKYWTHDCPRPFQGLRSNPALAVGLLDAELQFVYTGHFAPTRRVCRHMLLVAFQTRDQERVFLEQKYWIKKHVGPPYLHMNWILLSFLSVRSLLISQPSVKSEIRTNGYTSLHQWSISQTHVLAETVWPTVSVVFQCLPGFTKFLRHLNPIKYFTLSKQLICLKLESHHSLSLTFNLLQLLSCAAWRKTPSHLSEGSPDTVGLPQLTFDRLKSLP